MTLHATIAAFKLEAFFDSMCKWRPANMEKSRQCVASFIQMEELPKFHDKVRRDQKNLGFNKEKLDPIKEKEFKRQPR